MSALQGKIALVTGATGFLGGAVARHLAENEQMHVRALARRPNRDRYIRDIEHIDIVMGDITDAQRMQEITAGCDYVFHVAAALNGTLLHQQHVNVTGTHNVALAAAEAHVTRLVHISTIAVYGYVYEGQVTEDLPHQPGNVPYNISKSQAEHTLRTLCAQHDLDYTIIRSGMIYGPRSGAWTDSLFEWVSLPVVPFLGDGHGTAYPIYIDDIVDLIVTTATHPAASGEAFNGVNDPPPTIREFLGHYMQLAHQDRWLTIPVWLGKLVAPLADAYFTWRGQPQDVRRLIDFSGKYTAYSMDKARDLLGWQPQVPLREGIQRCVPYLEEKGLL